MLPRGTVGHTHRSRVGGRGGGPAVAARSRLSSRAWTPAAGDDLAGRASRPSRPSTTTAWAYRARLPLRLATTSRLRSVTTGTRPRGDRRGLRARPRCWTNVVDMRQSSRSRPNQAHASVAHSCPSASRSAGSGPHCRRTCTWGPGSHGSARGHDHGDASGRPRNSPLASDEQAVRFDCALPGFTPHVVVWNPARKVD